LFLPLLNTFNASFISNFLFYVNENINDVFKNELLYWGDFSFSLSSERLALLSKYKWFNGE